MDKIKQNSIVVIAVFLIMLVSFYFYDEKNQAPVSEKNLTETPIFQPEGQMTSQGVNKNSGIAENPVKSSANGKYVENPCQNGSSYTCLAEYYKNLVKSEGAKTAIEDMKLRGTKDAGTLAICHPLMHVIGRQAAQSYVKISDAFLAGDSYCWSGYHHGIMEGMIDKIGADNLAKELDNICTDIPGKETYNFDYYNCVHGLGHGIMAQFEDEVFKSLEMCDNLKGNWEQQSCYGGVYMQNIIDSTGVANTGNTVKYLKPEDPLYPCTAVAEKYKGQCYLGQTSYALQVSGFNLSKVFGMCATVDQPYRDICNQSMGRDIANAAGHNAEMTEKNCNIPSDLNDIKNCIVGAVKEIISYYHSDKEAMYFCSILETDFKNICNDTAKSYYSYF